MMRKECFTAGKDLINGQIRYFRARSKVFMSANIDLTAFSEMIFGDSCVRFRSEIRCIPCIFYNRVTPSVDIHVFSPTKRPIPVERARLLQFLILYSELKNN